MTEAKASNILTHYYKLAHVGSITYTIYASSENNDQALLELELTIRNKYPEILITYYNKNLYYFAFGHNLINSDSPIDLSTEFHQLSCKSSESVTADQLANPIKNHANNNENLTYAGLSFLKAVKKMILYNLSLNGSIRLFGNYCVSPNDDQSYSILCIDPKPNVRLFSSMVAYPEELAIETNFVIYLIPSGIRCHLFDPTNLRNNFIENPQVENEKLPEMLRLTTGIDCDKSKLWVKLIPNLKHLNNQTSFVGKFIHSVDNKKFILWPWDLCLLQFGKYEELQQEELSSASADYSNPMNLISDFLDFQITYNNQVQQQKQTTLEQSLPLPSQQQQQPQNQNQNQNQQQAIHGPFSVGSAQSTGIGSIGHIPDLPKDIGSIGLSATTPMDAELFNLQNTEEFFKTTEHNEIPIDQDQAGERKGTKEEEETDNKSGDDMEIDDLFGGEDSDGDSSNEQKDSAQISGENTGSGNSVSQDNSEQPPKDELDDLFADDSSIALEEKKDSSDDVVELEQLPKPKQEEDISKPKDIKPSYIDILKDQMMLKKSDSSPDYKDPGAPLPIVPTPLVPPTIPQSTGATNPPTVGPGSVTDTIYDGASIYNQSAPPSQMPQQKSVFSPILFNPIIKSDIDTKYGKGGKFYVDKDTASDTDFEKKKRSLRATSVSGMEINFSSEDKKKLQQQLDAIESSTTSESEYGDEEESDEDEEPDMADLTPLKLNESSALPSYQNPATSNIATIGPDFQNADKQFLGNQSMNVEGFGSPFGNQMSKFTMKPESPFMGNEMQTSMSPMYFDISQTQQSPQLQPSAENSEVTKSTMLEAPSKISESSNYLPLLLRNINVSSIPNWYLMNNLTSTKLLPTFSINDDDTESDLDITKSNELIVKLDHLKEFLSFIAPNIVFDLGSNNFGELSYYFNNSAKIESSKELKLPNKSFLESLLKSFPYSYPVKLAEFLHDTKALEFEDQLDNQLNFLNDIPEDENFIDPKALYKKLKSIEWDSFDCNHNNSANFEKYKETVEKLNTGNAPNEEDYFKLPIIKTKVMKNNNIINMNSIGLEFWKYLNFSPIKKTKNFQILLIAETHGNTSSYASELLNQLVQNYRENNFGTITKVNLSTVETRPDLEPINDGLVLINKEQHQSFNDFYVQTNKKLISLVELIKLDLINKTNNFEFDRPLLLLFVNFNKSLNSNLQICKIFRNFKVALMTHQLPLVEIFTKIVPSSLVAKKVGNETSLKILSNYKLTKISMNLYNECPNDVVNRSTVKNIFTTIVKEPPSKIQFRFINNAYRDNSFNDDIFLHLAYERSVDKNWFVASWSDPLGQVVHTKAWYCSNSPAQQHQQQHSSSSQQQTPSHHQQQQQQQHHNQQRQGYRHDTMDIMSISDDIWNISTELFKFLNDEMNSNGGNTFGGKKFLVLTRVNSIIPDDELVHWKRLSQKHKEISLIVLSVCQTPKIVGSSELQDFSSRASNFSPLPTNPEKDSFFNFKTAFSTSNNSSPASGGALVTSPNGLSFHSPQQFLNAPANFLSPQDLMAPSSMGNTPSGTMNNELDSDTILCSLKDDVYGVVSKLPLPSFNSPTRFCMKTGYLMKEVREDFPDDIKEEQDEQATKSKSYLLYEINLLSCSNYWNLDVLMRLLMLQYKKMIVLNDVLCMNSLDGAKEDIELSENYNAIVPWHINAVGKLLNYLVHVYVDEE
ncbi:SSN2 Mediator of RNA polymerase II transcription subunit 13 [Candida maltosa Xu316]